METVCGGVHTRQVCSVHSPNVKSRVFINFVKFPRETAAVGFCRQISPGLYITIIFYPLLFLFGAEAVDPRNPLPRPCCRRCRPPKVFIEFSAAANDRGTLRGRVAERSKNHSPTPERQNT